MSAKLYFRYGAMNCGKTTALLQAIHNYEDRNLHILLLKPQIDTKGDKKVVSRIGLQREVDHLVPEDEDLYGYLKQNDKGIGCIFIDEAQFLKRTQVDGLLEIVVKDDIPAICYGLRTDFNGNGFEGSTRLLEVAHTIEELKTICRCSDKATQNARMVNGKFTFAGDQVAIDGEQNITYDSLCWKCFFEEKEKFEREHPKLYMKKKGSSHQG